MLVSCICVCHDKPALTHEAIESIINQTYPHWEAIVVDSGVLHDAGHYDDFSWRNDPRLRLLRSEETAAIRRVKAMAPWCYNECFRKGLVSGDLVTYLCDDDVLYPNAFATFVSYARRHPHARAMYASEDLGVVYSNGWRTLVGERRATQPGGRSCGGRQMDCQVDYLQFCHRADVLKSFPADEYWPEDKDSEWHADGIFMERVGAHVTIHPIDVKVGQNRRTSQSLNIPLGSLPVLDNLGTGIPLMPPLFPVDRLLAAERVALWKALSAQQLLLERLTTEHRALQAHLGSWRYQLADRFNEVFSRVPSVKRCLKWLLSLSDRASSAQTLVGDGRVSHEESTPIPRKWLPWPTTR